MKPNDGRTALMLAVARGRKEVVKMLLEAGADIQGKGNATIALPKIAMMAMMHIHPHY